MVHATEGLADFERQQLRYKATLDRLRRTIDVQCGRAEPRNLEERLVRKKELSQNRQNVEVKNREQYLNFP